MEHNSLLQRLETYASEDHLPMHMPGHKRCDVFPYPAPFPFKYDITEIDGFDDLNCPSEIFLESQRIAAALWGSDECLYSVNGSSGAILASIRGVLGSKKNRNVLVSRGCHKSVYNGLELCRATPIYLSSSVNEYGFHTAADACEVERKLNENPGTELVIITSPTYEGVISDVASIARICHRFGAVLIVDEAHGAHLSLHGVFPDGAISCGADIVVQSIHKTLPSLTQTALLHIKSDLVDKDAVKRQMTVFQSTSPSYILSASIDSAVRFLASDDGKKRLEAWHSSVIKARESLRALKNLSLYESDSYDVSKFVICGAGNELSSHLREFHKTELEMSSLCYVIAMTGAGDTDESLNRFVKAVLESDSIFTNPSVSSRYKDILPKQMMIPAEAVECPYEELELPRCVGRISAEYIYAYPPGVPIIVPGELCDENFVNTSQSYIEGNVSLRGLKNGKIKVIKE